MLEGQSHSIEASDIIEIEVSEVPLAGVPEGMQFGLVKVRLVTQEYESVPLSTPFSEVNPTEKREWQVVMSREQATDLRDALNRVLD